MKIMKKISALVIAMVMVLAMALPAMAEGEAPATTGQKITIGNAVEGEIYTAYKLMDATWEGTLTENTPIAYFYQGTATDALYGILDDYFQFDDFVGGRAYLKVVDGDGKAIDYKNVNAAGLAAALKEAQDAGTITLTVAGTATAAKVNDKVVAEITVNDKGYYFVNTTLGAVCSIDTADNVTINEKNTTTTTDKSVQEDSTESFGDKDDAQIGDTVNFKSVVTIGKGQKNVVFHDVMQTDKLAFNTTSVVVTGAPEGKYTIKTGAEAATGDTFTVEFDNAWTQSLTAATTDVTITYSATLTAAAIVGDQSGLALDAGNDNKSKVTYGNAQSTEWDWTRTYTWSFDILKYTGSDDNKTPLANAKFQFKLGTTALTFTLVTAGDATKPSVYRYDKDATNTELVTPASGLITLSGLDADTYTLTETEAPQGYNKLTEDVTVILDSNTDTDQGNDGTHQADATLTIKQGDVDVDQVEILNNTGSTLPSTGGIGTTIFYVIGGILVVLAGVVLVTKRKSAE